MIRSDSRTTPAAFYPPAFDVLPDDVGIEAPPQFDAREVALRPVDSVVVARRQKDGRVLFAQFGAKLRRH